MEKNFNANGQPESLPYLFVIDLDYLREDNTKNITSKAIIRLFCRSKTRKAYLVHVHDFYPYFFVLASIEEIRDFFSCEYEFKEWLFSLEEVQLRRYDGGELLTVTKITGFSPWNIPRIRQAFRDRWETFEDDIPFIQRFAIDIDLRGWNWITIRNHFASSESNNVIILHTHSDEIETHSQDNSCPIYRPVVLAFDIEVDETGETIHELLSSKKRMITAVSASWGIKKARWESEALIAQSNDVEGEKVLLENFLSLFNEIDPDIIVTFNGTSFDFPYLLARLKILHIPSNRFSLFRSSPVRSIFRPRESYRCLGRCVIDLFPRTWHLHPLSGKKNLTTISEMILGEKKVPISDSLGNLWRKGLQGNQKCKETFVAYSKQDSILTYRLYWKLGVEEYLNVVQLTGYVPPPEGLLTTGRNLGEFELIRILKYKGILIPRLPNNEELASRKALRRKYPHKGGLTLSPSEPVYNQVVICDFHSMYPSIILSANLGAETFKGTNVRILKHNLSTDLQSDRGSFAELAGRLLAKRTLAKREFKKLNSRVDLSFTENEQKDRLNTLQKSIKLVANSVIGATNYTRGRFYHHAISNSITETGRTLIQHLQKWVEEYSRISLKVIYGDTDSIFLAFENTSLITDFYKEQLKNEEITDNELFQEIERILSFLINRISEEYRLNLQLELEDIAFRIVFKKGRKKAYAYRSAMKPKETVIKGFEAIRSDWSPIARDLQKRLLDILLTTKEVKDAIPRGHKFILNYCVRILKGKSSHLRDKLIILGAIYRDPKKYRAKTPALGAFLHYCEVNGLDPSTTWKEFDRFPYLIVRGKGKSIQYSRARHPSFVKDNEIDKEHYIEEIIRAANRFGINVTINDVKLRAYSYSLYSYFH